MNTHTIANVISLLLTTILNPHVEKIRMLLLCFPRADYNERGG